MHENHQEPLENQNNASDNLRTSENASECSQTLQNRLESRQRAQNYQNTSARQRKAQNIQELYRTHGKASEGFRTSKNVWERLRTISDNLGPLIIYECGSENDRMSEKRLRTFRKYSEPLRTHEHASECRKALKNIRERPIIIGNLSVTLKSVENKLECLRTSQNVR